MILIRILTKGYAFVKSFAYIRGPVHINASLAAGTIKSCAYMKVFLISELLIMRFHCHEVVIIAIPMQEMLSMSASFNSCSTGKIYEKKKSHSNLKLQRNGGNL